MGSSGFDPAGQQVPQRAIPPPQFKTSRRGFDQDQVAGYIAQLTDRLQTVENLVRQLRSTAEQAMSQRDAARQQRDAARQELEAAVHERDVALQERPPAQVDSFEQVSDRVSNLLVALDRDVATIRAEAETEADRIVADATDHADRLRREAEAARNGAVAAAEVARRDAERSVTHLTARRDALRSDLRRTCDGFLEVIERLAASIEVDALDGLPGGDDGPTVVIPQMLPDRPA